MLDKSMYATWRWFDDVDDSGIVIMAHVNTGPEHMPDGLDEHLDYLRRLAARGERDES